MKKIMGKPQSALLLVVIFWGSTFAVTKYVLGENVPPILYVTARYVLGAFVMLALYPVLGRRNGVLPSLFRGLWGKASLLGLLQALGIMLQVFGQLYTTASKSSFLTAFSIPLVPILAWMFYKDRPQWMQLVAVFVGMFGLGLLTYPDREFGFNRGDLFTLGSAAVYAVAIVKTARYSKADDALRLATVQTVFVTCILIFFLLLVHLLPTDAMRTLSGLEHRTFTLSLGVICAWLYMAVICIGVTFTLQMWAMAQMKATQAAVIFALEPVFATVIALAIFGASEMPKARGFVGAALILVAVFLSELRQKSTGDAVVTQPVNV